VLSPDNGRAGAATRSIFSITWPLSRLSLFFGPNSASQPAEMSTATHRSLSIDEFVDHFENAIKENQSLESRLAKALDEIETLRAQLQPDTRLKSLLALKEKLIRDEFEMKYRDLQVQVKQMRTQYTRQVEEMKAQMKGQLSTCICHGAGLR